MRALYARWLAVGLLLTALGVGLVAALPAAWSGRDFYRSGPGAVLALSGAGMALLLPASALWRILPTVVRSAIAYMSARVTALYAISWVVICSSVDTVGFMAVERPVALVGLVTFVFTATFAIDAALTWPARRGLRTARPAS